MMIRALALAMLCALAGCGGPADNSSADTTSDSGAPVAACGLASHQTGEFVTLDSGSFMQAAQPVYPEERRTLRVHVTGFTLQAHEVTNAQFAEFVRATDYVTDAEHVAEGSDSPAGSAVFVPPQAGEPGRWTLVPGASWRNPEGPQSDIAGRAMYPVVHVSLHDARAYADWVGGRLPREEEWEYAAATGLGIASGEGFDPLVGVEDADGAPIANIWQGAFPISNDGADGFAGTAPVGCFPADQNGAHDMIGNVWEWTDSPAGEGRHVIKGGSHLCAENYCQRYRPAARQRQDDGFSSSHIGFRIVRDVVTGS